MQEVTDILKQSIQYSLDHRPRQLNMRCNMAAIWIAIWRINSSECTSTTGRWTTARGGRRSPAAEGRGERGWCRMRGKYSHGEMSGTRQAFKSVGHQKPLQKASYLSRLAKKML